VQIGLINTPVFSPSSAPSRASSRLKIVNPTLSNDKIEPNKVKRQLFSISPQANEGAQRYQSQLGQSASEFTTLGVAIRKPTSIYQQTQDLARREDLQSLVGVDVYA
jgi:hypothetical protein